MYFSNNSSNTANPQPFQNQSNLLNFDNLQKPLCPGGYQLTHICFNPTCKITTLKNQSIFQNTNNSFICSNIKCRICCSPDGYDEQQDLQVSKKLNNHQKCQIMKYSRILSIIKKKIKNSDLIKNYIKKIFDDFIDQLSELRQLYLKKVKYCGLSQSQQKFVTCFEKNKYTSINPQLNAQIVKQLHNQLQINIPTIKQNLQKYWNDQKLKFQNIFESIGQKLSKEEFNRLQAKLKINSKIVISQKQIKDLKKLLEDQESKEIKQVCLLYRASENQFSTKKFHQKCDDMKNTLIVVQTEYGKKIGGYTSLKWNNSSGNYQLRDFSGKSFVYSLTNNHKFTVTYPQQAIYRNPNLGPIFGGGSYDICVCDKSNIKKNSCANIGNSYSHPEYKYQDQPSWTKFSGAVNGSQFIVKQWQVFEIRWV